MPTIAKNKKTVIVGMSGGVDSSVAALRLKQQGYHVEGLFMRNWDSDDNDPHCTATQDLSDARLVCDKLNIPLHQANFASEYWDRVFKHFLDEYAAGRTPNPDILCNKEIKFKAFLDHAKDLGADYIATGHYATIKEKTDGFHLLQANDHNKDQTYFLYTLQQKQLSQTLFPLGELKKQTVREIAKAAELPIHNKKDSTGICFIGERKFSQFLSEYLLTKPGDIKTELGETIGQHQGIMFYTLGQRKGLNLGGMKNAKESPWYVIDKDIKSNVIYVAQEHDHLKLMGNKLICDQLHWVSAKLPNTNHHYQAKIRYRQQTATCEIQQLNQEQLLVVFEQPQWAITPGQSIVFYKDDECIGGGVIVTGSEKSAVKPLKQTS